jgi:hypothetical protein
MDCNVESSARLVDEDGAERAVPIMLVCSDCVQVRIAEDLIEGNPEGTWFKKRSAASAERYPDADFRAKKADGRLTKREQKALEKAPKVVHLSWFD